MWQFRLHFQGALTELNANEALLNDLMDWLSQMENRMYHEDDKPIPENIPIIDQLLNAHQTFQAEIQERQPDVERLTKTGKKAPGPTGLPILRHTRRGSPRKLMWVFTIKNK